MTEWLFWFLIRILWRLVSVIRLGRLILISSYALQNVAAQTQAHQNVMRRPDSVFVTLFTKVTTAASVNQVMLSTQPVSASKRQSVLSLAVLKHVKDTVSVNRWAA
jgi:hypothetical protein